MAYLIDHNVNKLCNDSRLDLAIFGAELSLNDLLNPKPDLSILLEDISDNCFSMGTAFVDCLYSHLAVEGDSIRSIWLEFDFPYNYEPLIYLTLKGHHDTTSIIDIFSQMRDLDKTYRKDLFEACIYPNKSELHSWLTKCSFDTIQQFGLSYRNYKVQPRLLATLPSTQFDNYLSKSNLIDLLKIMIANQQCLAAFAYPYLPEQFFGCEILSDFACEISLRELRYAPRLRGTRFEKLLKAIILQLYSESDSLDFLKDLKSLERKISRFQISQMSARNTIELSGWNHIKLGFKNGENYSAKLYGGSVLNYI